MRVQAEYSLFTPLYVVAAPSDPATWYPPAIAACITSWMVIGASLSSVSLLLRREINVAHYEGGLSS